jgi:hypothetical protein
MVAVSVVPLYEKTEPSIFFDRSEALLERSGAPGWNGLPAGTVNTFVPVPSTTAEVLDAVAATEPALFAAITAFAAALSAAS